MDKKNVLAETNSVGSRILNLPAELQGLDCVGRERELDFLQNLLLNSQLTYRLVTLQGPGGSGKTTLLVETAQRLLANFSDGVVFVAGNTIPAAQPNLLLNSLANALDLKEQANTNLLDTLTTYLEPRRMLVVLDNLEHLLPGLLPALKDLLRVAPRVRILVSSQVKLGLPPYEYVFIVPPLATPGAPNTPLRPSADLNDLNQNPAVQLFVKQARTVNPDFALSADNAGEVVELVNQADGMPLAIGLTAVRSSLMSTRGVLDDLKNQLNNAMAAPVRPRPNSTNPIESNRVRPTPARPEPAKSTNPAISAIQNTLAWSYNLLESDEKKLLRRLAVFVGGCNLAAVRQVCVLPAPGSTGDIYLGVEERLASLRRSGLVLLRNGQNGEPRYSLLEPVREYGWAQVTAEGEGELLQNRHASYYLELARQAFVALKGEDQLRWLEIMETEQANLRSALDWTLNQPAPTGQTQARLEIGMELAYRVWAFWNLRGYASEARQWLDLAIDKVRAANLKETAHFAKLLETRAHLARLQTDLTTARQLGEESLAIYQRLGNQQGVADVTGNLAMVHSDAGQLDLAQKLFQEALAMKEALGDREGIAILLNNQAILWYHRGDYQQSRRLFEQSLTIARNLGDPSKIVVGLGNLAEINEELGDYNRAEQYLQEAQAINEKLGYKSGLALTLVGLAGLALVRKDYTAARTYTEKSVDLYREIGNLKNMMEQLRKLGRLETEARHYADALNFYRQAAEVNHQLGDLQAEQIQLLEGLGWLVAHRYSNAPNLVKAVQLYAAAQTLRQKLGVTNALKSVQDKTNEETLAQLRQQLGPQQFEQGWQSGLQMEASAALEYGLNS